MRRFLRGMKAGLFVKWMEWGRIDIVVGKKSGDGIEKPAMASLDMDALVELVSRRSRARRPLFSGDQ